MTRNSVEALSLRKRDETGSWLWRAQVGKSGRHGLNFGRVQLSDDGKSGGVGGGHCDGEDESGERFRGAG